MGVDRLKKAWVGTLLLVSVAGFCVCFGGASSGRDDVATAGFIMLLGGSFGALASIIAAEVLDA